MLQLQYEKLLCQQLYQASKKLESVLATSVPVIDGGKEVVVRVLCIHYLV